MIISFHSSAPKTFIKPGISPVQFRDVKHSKGDNNYKYTAWQASIFPGITLYKDHMGLSVSFHWLFWGILIEPGDWSIPKHFKTK